MLSCGQWKWNKSRIIVIDLFKGRQLVNFVSPSNYTTGKTKLSCISNQYSSVIYWFQLTKDGNQTKHTISWTFGDTVIWHALSKSPGHFSFDHLKKQKKIVSIIFLFLINLMCYVNCSYHQSLFLTFLDKQTPWPCDSSLLFLHTHAGCIHLHTAACVKICIVILIVLSR